MRSLILALLFLIGCKNGPTEEKPPAPIPREGERPALFAKRVCLSTGAPKACVTYARALGLGKGGLRRDVRAALHRLSGLCEENRVEACLLLGRWSRKGSPLKKDLAKAAQWLELACDGGLSAACHEWGEVRLARGASLHALATLFERACLRRVAGACLRAGEAQRTKEIREKWFTRGCDLGNHLSCVRLASIIATRGQNQHQRAIKLARRACEAKTGTACFTLFSLLRKTDTSQKTKLEWLKKGCRLGDADCCEMLGSILFNSPGNPENRRLAFGYLRSACDAEHRTACAWLGDYWHRHAADGSQTTVAIDYIAKACVLNDTTSCATLFRYATGLLTDKLKERWVKGLLLRGCELRGRGRVCLEAAKIVQKTFPRLAQTYTMLACSGNDAEACLKLLPRFVSP